VIFAPKPIVEVKKSKPKDEENADGVVSTTENSETEGAV
jgi:hypothetical protein